MSTEFQSTSLNQSMSDSVEDARKRRFNESDAFGDSDMSKRRRPTSAVEAISEGPINVKILVPTSVAGVIIGKNGETIATLEKDTKCQITMSKPSETFPKTTERVVLITGKFQQVIDVITFIQEKIRDRRDLPVAPDPFDYKYALRTLQLKMIVPGSSAGVIIGKGGEFVRNVQDTSGVHVQMSTKDMTIDLGTNERVITLAGTELNQLLNGAQMIISKISQDPNIHAPSYINTNYYGAQPSSSTRGRYASPDRDRYSRRGFEFDQMPRSAPRPFAPHWPAAPAPANDWPSPNAAGGVGNLQVLQFLDGLGHMLRTNGYNEPDVAEIMQAMQVLAKHNVLGLGFGFGLSAISESIGRNGGPMAGDPGRRDIGSSSSQPYDERTSSRARAFAESLFKIVREEPNLLEMSVTDAVAGALLGKQGRRMNEAQLLTGATIDISKRKPGEGQGGRRPNRQIIIQGTPESITAARRELEAAVTEEMMRR